jgi:hypothetical protein
MTRPGRSLMPPAARLLARQFSAFFGVGVLAAAVHYGLLIALVEGWRTDPVAAALAGYVAGGVSRMVSTGASPTGATARTGRRPGASPSWRGSVSF